MCELFLGFYALTECDHTGKFTGFAKETCWKVMMDSLQHILNAFQLKRDDKISAQIKTDLKDVYFRGRSSSVDNLASQCWYFRINDYLQQVQHSDRRFIHVICNVMQWKLSHFSKPVFPTATEVGLFEN